MKRQKKQHNLPHQIVIRPIVTEKISRVQEEDNNIYAFQVKRSASKVEIRDAIEKKFGVKVAKINTQIMPGKWHRVGSHQGRRPNWKKAIVTLYEGDAITFFEGV